MCPREGPSHGLCRRFGTWHWEIPAASGEADFTAANGQARYGDVVEIHLYSKKTSLAFVGAVVMVMAACGGSGDSDGAAPTPSEPASAAATELRALVAKADARTFQATYDATITGDGLSGAGTLVLAQEDGREATRLSLNEAEGTPFTDIVLVAGGDKTTACFGDGDRGTCLKATGDAGSAFPNPLDLGAMLDRIEGDGDVARLPDEQPGGIASHCFKTSSNVQDGAACFATDTGIPTRLDVTTEGNRVAVAVTGIKDTVDAAVFDTPQDYVTLGR